MVMYCVFTLHCPFSAGVVPGICGLTPQCGAFSRDMLDGMQKTPAIPEAGAVLTYDLCIFALKHSEIVRARLFMLP